MTEKSPLKFFLIVFGFSIPFWIIERFINIKGLPLDIPILEIFAAFAPLATACILVHKEGGKGAVKKLLKRIFDFSRIEQKRWYLAIIFLPFIIYLLIYVVMYSMGLALPGKVDISLIDVPLLIILFLIGAIAEELGWTAYATDILQKKQGSLKTALIIGVVWAKWHIIPFWQAHRTINWIFWQCIGTIALRIILVWLYNKTGQSVFATIICHTTINLSEFYFPNYGSHYDPFYFGIILILTAVIIIFFGFSRKPLKAKWQPKTD